MRVIDPSRDTTIEDANQIADEIINQAVEDKRLVPIYVDPEWKKQLEGRKTLIEALHKTQPQRKQSLFVKLRNKTRAANWRLRYWLAEMLTGENYEDLYW